MQNKIDYSKEQIIKQLKSNEVYSFARCIVNMVEKNTVEKVGEEPALRVLLLELYEALPILQTSYKKITKLVESEQIGNPTTLKLTDFLKHIKKVLT